MSKFTLPQGDLLVAAERFAWAEAALNHVMSDEFAQNFTQKVNLEASTDDEDGDFWDPDLAWVRPYQVKDGVLTIPIRGLLVNRFPYALFGWITGYEYIEKAVARGVDDSNVDEIVLDIDSGGGYVSGCFDCADAIYALRGTKPIRAIANESAYSAAYAVASAADSINVVRTGGVGSIGVLGTHVEMSEALAQRGIKVTLVHAGKHKTEGHSAVPLSDTAKKRWQDRVDNTYGIFVATVARNRGLDEQMVRGTEAATFMPHEAVENGLADAIGPLGPLSANADPSQNDEDDQMSKDNNPAVDQAAHETAVVNARAEGVEAGKAEGATAERQRVSAILDSDEAKTRPAAARMMVDLGVDAEQAKAQLGKLPEEAKTDTPADTGSSNFEKQMNADGGAGVGADGGNDPDEMSVADSIFASAGHAPVKH